MRSRSDNISGVKRGWSHQVDQQQPDLETQETFISLNFLPTGVRFWF